MGVVAGFGDVAVKKIKATESAKSLETFLSALCFGVFYIFPCCIDCTRR